VRNTFPLRKLVIKPTLICNQNCKTCASRRELHHLFARQKSLSVSEWEAVLSDAHDLGNRQLSISGGEPTVYKPLMELIRLGKRYKWPVSMNTNGSLITGKFARRLLENGLDQVRISLYSLNPQMHGEMRSNERLWEKAKSAVGHFAALRKHYPDFSLVTQTLISRDNYRHLPELIKLHYELGSMRMHLSYLEGDFDRQFLMNEEELHEFKTEVIPRAISVCGTLERSARREATRVLENLYNEDQVSLSEYADGVYRPQRTNPKPCAIPKRQAIILANGDVHPCNVVEYAHDPVVGNIFEQSFAEIWAGQKRGDFINNYFCGQSTDYCELCPMDLHKDFRLRIKGNTRFRQGLKMIRQRL
jgi:radical SAM protein with 4Fe4S-binding SPASM domain